MMDDIPEFQGSFRFLSNFFPDPRHDGLAEFPIHWLGYTVPTVEHAFQLTKTLDHGERQAIASAANPGLAKRLGAPGHCTLRPDWERIKLQVMETLVWQKFSVHVALTNALLATRDLPLIEGNSWGDTFWGVCNGEGENHLGQILMQVRNRLRVMHGLDLLPALA